MRTGRLFERESGRTFVAAFDHGLSLKISPDGQRAPEVVRKVVSDEPDGVLPSASLPEWASRLFAFRGTLLQMVRSDFVGVGAAVGRG